MAKRERVGPLPAASASQQLQTPWGLTETPEAAETVAEQHTEVAAFVRSPSPAVDSPSSRHAISYSHKDQEDSGKGQDARSWAGQESASNAAQSLPLDSSLQRTSDLLEASQQLKTTKGHSFNQLKGPEHVRQRKPHRTGTADIHMIGEITGAVGFGQQALYCTWQLVYDSQLWEVSRGLAQGRTHASSPLLPEDGGLSGVVWETPLDLALTTTSMQHWPQIVFKIFHRSIWLGRDEFVGYSLCNLPITPGCHHLSCPVWAAVEASKSFKQELTSWFTGLTPQLVDERFITDLEQRYEQGQHLHTQDWSGSSPCFFSGTHSPITAPSALAVDCISTSVSSSRYCRSFSAAGGGGTAAAGPAWLAGTAAGGRICLRLHVISRGLSQLRILGGESVGKALERLKESVDQMRRQQGQHAAHYDEEEEETEGVRLVREGRASRLAAVQQHLDGSRDRDQHHLLDSSDAGSAAGSFSSRRGTSPGRASPSRNSRLHYTDGGSPGSSWSGSRQHAGSRTETDGEGTPSRNSRAGRPGTKSVTGTGSPIRQTSPGRVTSSTTADSDPAAVASGEARGTGGGASSLGASWRTSRESLGASRQQYGSPLRGRLAPSNAGDLQQTLPAPRFGTASTAEGLRRHQDLQESGSSVGNEGDD